MYSYEAFRSHSSCPQTHDLAHGVPEMFGKVVREKFFVCFFKLNFAF